MIQKKQPHKEKKLSLYKRIKRKLYRLFRLYNHPVIRVYHGYGNAEKIIVIGHVLKLSPMPRRTYRNNWIVNTFSMLRFFMVKPYECAKVFMEWEGSAIEVETQDDGFFRFEWNPQAPPIPGWHHVFVYLNEEKYMDQNISGKGAVFIPYKSQHAFISDIDDTFLISHSANLRRRLYVLFTKNARSRKPFEGVVHHYQLLASAGQKTNFFNPFFYVSSSEWNLYDMIMEFSTKNQLPAGVYLLNQLKRFSEVFNTGQNKHQGKFTRIVRIIETFPDLQFILLGDDTQEDPNIYLSIALHFPKNIFAVYIRNILSSRSTHVEDVMNKIKAAGIYECYFRHSAEAIQHSEAIGLIKASKPV